MERAAPGEIRVTSYRDLAVWRKAMDVARDVYGLVRGFPKAEEYRLTAQLVRAAVSIPANIAEGNARGTRKDYANFVSIARGSAAELETLLILTAEVGFAPLAATEPLLDRVAEVGRMLNALRRRLSMAPGPQSPISNP